MGLLTPLIYFPWHHTMKTNFKKTPRIITLEHNNRIHEFRDVGDLTLEENELISLRTNSGRQHDIVAKSWGYYLSPSLNKRLYDEGFKTALVKNSQNRLYVMTVEIDKLEEFLQYLKETGEELIEYLDERYQAE